MFTIVILLFFACRSEEPAPLVKEVPQSTSKNINSGPDILLLTIDTLRADRVGAYGDSLAKTPEIDRLAAQGVLFREAHALTPLTLPSHASMLTGLLPKKHGLRDNGGFRLADNVTTVAEVLKTKQYQTGAFVSAYVLHPAWGLDKGFDVYPDPFHPMDVAKVTAFGEAEIPSAETINRAVAWWKKTKGPRFAWVHLYDPHLPWKPVAGWKGDPYRGEIAQVDRNVRRLFKAIGPQTLIVLTSDHGESLWEHGEREHGLLIHRSVTRVPLIIRPPGGLKGKMTPPPRQPILHIQRPKGVDEKLDLQPVADSPVAAKVIEDVVSGIDIGPTIAAYAGLSMKADGRSLRPLIEGQKLTPKSAYAETFFPYFHFGWHPLRMSQDQTIRIEQGKYLDVRHWQDDKPATARAEQVQWLTEQFGDIPQNPGPIDDKTTRMLEALGYLTDVVEVDLAKASDARQRVEILQRLQLAENSQPEQAISLLQDIIEQEPQLVRARLSLSLMYAAQGKKQQALDECQLILRSQPHHTGALNNAGLIARELKRYDLALDFADRMQKLNPKDARGYRLAAAVYADREEPENVIIVGKQGLQVAPNDPNLHYLVGLASIFSGQAKQAIPHLQAARQYRSRAKDLSLWLGVAAQRSGDIDKAKLYYEQASKELLGDLRPWAMGGVMLADADRCQEARSFLLNVARRGGQQDPKIQAALQKCKIKP